MDSDSKEEEPFIDERLRVRSRRNISSESFGMQLQYHLEQITKLMKIYDPKNEFTTNALIEYTKSLDVNKNINPLKIKDEELEQDVNLMIDFKSLYSNALKTISEKEREIEKSRFECRQMAHQLDKYKQQYSHRIDDANDDSKEDQLLSSWPNALNTSIIDNGSVIDDNFQNESEHENEDLEDLEDEEDEEDEDEDESYYSGSDYPLISNHIMFKCPDDYPPIRFINYNHGKKENNDIESLELINDDNESLNGIQTDWDSDTSDIELDESEQEQEDEFNDLFQEWNHLRIKYENLENKYNLLQNQKDEMRMKFENKCKECDELRQKLRILSGDSEPNK